MATTMKKSEITSAIRATALEKLNLDALGAVQIDTGVWAIPTGEVDGLTTYAKVAVTAANPTGTEKVPAFDLDEAVADWQAECEEREAKAKAKAEEKARKAAEREAKAKAKSDE